MLLTYDVFIKVKLIISFNVLIKIMKIMKKYRSRMMYLLK